MKFEPQPKFREIQFKTCNLRYLENRETVFFSVRDSMIHMGTVLHSAAMYILPRIVDTDDTALFVVSFLRGLI